METIVLASDHGGFALKEQVKLWLAEAGYAPMDLGCADETTSVDYPDYAKRLVEALRKGLATRGVLICGTGIGMSIAANRYSGIRATLVHDATTARFSRAHNDSNVLVMGARVLSLGTAREIVSIWLCTPYDGGRHDLRLNKLEACSGDLE